MTETAEYGELVVRFCPAQGCLADTQDRLVEALSHPRLGPTHWGGDPATDPFSPADLRRALRTGDRSRPFLRRSRVPKWFGGYGEGQAYFWFKPAVARKWWGEIFVWADDLADVFRPRFGACHPGVVFDDCVDNNWSVLAHREELQRVGLPWLGARTYLGGQLVEAIGIETIRSSGVERVVQTDWGARVELVGDPWRLSASEFVARQSSVMSRLTQTGLFGRYGNGTNDPKRARKWKRSLLPD